MAGPREIFETEFSSAATAAEKIELLKNILNDPEKSRIVFAKEKGEIYCSHPVMNYFHASVKAGADTIQKLDLAEHILESFGPLLIFFDLEYFCEYYPTLRNRILLEYPDHFTSDMLGEFLGQELKGMQIAHAITFITAIFEKLSSIGFKHNLGKLNLATFRQAVEAVNYEAADYMFAKYFKKNLLRDSESIAKAKFSLDEIETYLGILESFLSESNLLRVINECAANTLYGSPDYIPMLLEKLGEQVDKPLHLKIMDSLSKTYADLSSHKKYSLSQQEHMPIVSKFYQAQVDKFFKSNTGYSIEFYRLERKAHPECLIPQRLFAYDQLKVKIPGDSDKAEIKATRLVC